MPNTKAGQAGLSYLRKHQRPDGGFALGGSGSVNSQSTAWAVQGMIAVGADPATISSGGSSALDYLAARQADDGHYRYSESSDQTPVWVTGQVLVAVAGDALPIEPPPRQPTPTTVSPSKAAPLPPAGGTSPPPGFEAAPAPSGVPSTGSTGAPSAPPTASGAVPTLPPEGGVESEGSEPGAAQPSSAVPSHPVSASGSPPSPWLPIGVGLAATALAIGVPWWLGRRFAW